MTLATGTKSVGTLVRNPAQRFARVIPTAKSVVSGLGRFPRATMRQSGPVGGGMPSVDRIQVNPAFTPTPGGPEIG